MDDQKPRGEQIPRSPDLPPRDRRHQEAKGKGKGKSKKGGKSGKEEVPKKKKKKNKGVKRGIWWEGYLASRASRRSKQPAEGEAIEEEAESEESEGNKEAEAAISERLERWADAEEETGP